MISPSDLDRPSLSNLKSESHSYNQEGKNKALSDDYALNVDMLSKEEIILKNSLSLLDPIQVSGVICIGSTFKGPLGSLSKQSVIYPLSKKNVLEKKLSDALKDQAFHAFSGGISKPFLARLWSPDNTSESGDGQSYILTKTFGPHGLSGLFLLEIQKVNASINESVLEHVQHVTQNAFSRLVILGRQFVADTRLTPREKDIIKWIAYGKSNIQIAELMNISIHTVNGYLRAIYLKTNTTDRVSVGFYALHNGLLD